MEEICDAGQIWDDDDDPNRTINIVCYDAITFWTYGGESLDARK